MKTWRYILVAFFIVLFIGICCLFVFLLTHSSGSNHSLDRNTTLQNTASYDVVKVQQLKIEYGNMPFDINFVITDEAQLRIEEYCNKDLSEYSTQRIEEEGDRLTIIRHPKVKSIFNQFINRTYGSIIVYLPRHLTETLESLATSTTFDITFPDMEATPKQIALSTISGTIEAPTLLAEQLTISMTSGGIDLGNISGEISISSTSGYIRLGTVDGNLRVSSTSGSTTIQSVTGSLNVSMTSGSLSVHEMSGNVEVDSTSGAIDLAMTNNPGDIFLDITSGDVDITYPQGSAVSFDINTASGTIGLPNDSIYTKQERRSKKGSFGNNPVSTLTVDSTSGSIDIEIIPGL